MNNAVSIDPLATQKMALALSGRDREIERLRAALKEAADAYNNGNEDDCVVACMKIAESGIVEQERQKP